MDRPKIKDLKERYKFDGFFLSGDGVLGSYVCMWESPKANRIVGYLRRRGYLCIYQKFSPGNAHWCIKNRKEEKWK